MPLPTFNLTDGNIRSAASIEIGASGADLESSLLDYAAYGTVGAATSAIVGIVNTGVALGELLGVADKESYVDEAEAVYGLFGKDAAEFYSQHKTGVDMLGLLGGSLIPGLAAVRGLRAAQSLGKLPVAAQLRTGMKNPDLLLNSKALDVAKKSVLNTGVKGISNSEVRRAYATGVKQQFLESVVFDLAIATTMNQNSLLNPDDLGYFESAKNVLIESIPFTFFGGAIGGAVEVLRAKGAIKKYVDSRFVETGELASPRIKDLEGLTPGDKFLRISEAAAAHASIANTVGTDAFRQGRYATGQNIIRKMILKTAKEAGIEGADQIALIENLTNRAMSGELEEISHVLSAITDFSAVSKRDLERMTDFYDRVIGPSAVFKGTDVNDLAQQISTRQQEFASVLSGLGVDTTDFFTPGYVKFIYIHGLQGNLGQVTKARLNAGPMRLSMIKLDKGGDTGFLVPDFAAVNEGSIEQVFALNNALRSIPKNFTVDDFKDFVLLHEMGHVKSNTPKLLTLVENSYKWKKPSKSVEQLIRASVRARKSQWESALGGRGEEELVQQAISYFKGNRESNGLLKYLGSPEELLADGAAYFTHPKTRERAAKQFPAMGKLFERDGPMERMWRDTEAYINMRTTEVKTGAYFGINDVAKKAPLVKSTKLGGIEMHVPELNRTFTREGAKRFLNIGKADLDPLDFDGEWNIVSRAPLDNLWEAGNKIDPDDLFLLERLATDKNVATGEFQVGEQLMTQAQLRDFTIQKKKEYQLKLATFPGFKYTNEHKISKILNVDMDEASGIFKDDGTLLMGIKDFTKPEYVKVAYKHKTPAEYQNAAINLAATNARAQVQKELRERTAAEILGPAYKNFEDAPTEKVYDISPTESRAALASSARPDFDSFRSFAAFTGKLLRQLLSNTTQEVHDAYLQHFNKFNKVENVQLRQELVHIDNVARRNWYYQATDLDGKTVLVEKNALAEYAKELDISLDEAADALDATAFAKGTMSKDPEIISLSDDMAEYVRFHVRTNAEEIVDKKIAIGKAAGRDPVLDRRVFYPPPRDLTTEKFHAFVIPTTAMQGSDPRKYMIYGRTEEEFAAKAALVEQKYGGQYRVLTQKDDINLYKELKGEINKDLIFDEIHFDPGMVRKGTSSEFLPNLDFQRSATLDRYRDWTIRQKQNILREGVSIKYGEEIQALKNLDEEYGRANRTVLSGVQKGADSIYKDTINLMMDSKSLGSVAEQTYVRINDFAGKAGSQLLDGLTGALKGKKEFVTNEDMIKYNDAIAEAGIVAPTRTAMEAILTSPEIKDSRTLNELVRTASNLTSTFMLKLDQAHTLLQLVSTPILALPVLQELKDVVAVRNLVSVPIPGGNGAREPGVVRLLMEGSKEFFSPEGKAFMQELRDRNIVSDYVQQYLDAVDFAGMHGNHTLQRVSKSVDKLADFGSRYWSGFKFMEEFTRFQVAYSARRIAEAGGLSRGETWATINSAVDKVHGVYLGSQRPQLFQGVLGQAMGLYQTYFFNFMQNALKYVADGDKKQLITMAAMQGTIFGAQSFPGFQQMNQLIGETNRGNLDLYNTTGADDPESMAAYFMYGLGSHSLGFPIDFYNRGSLSLRHPTVVPTSPWDFPVVSTLARTLTTAYDTGKAIGKGAPIGEALLNGMAHNGMNRPLQGLADVLRNEVTSKSGQVQFNNTNYYPLSEEIDYGSIFARVIGARPLDEAIIKQSYYRDAAYQANTRRELDHIGSAIKLDLKDGRVEPQDFSDFAREYEVAGGDPQSFNAYWQRQLRNAPRAEMEEFYSEMEKSKAYKRMLLQQQRKQVGEP